MAHRTPSARNRLTAWRRSRPKTPLLEPRTVRARGLNFAVWASPPVPNATPMLAINGGLIYGHDLLWPTFAPFAADRQVFFYDQRGRGDSAVPPGARASRIEHDVLDIPALRDALGIAQWDLVGHSWGGGLALLAAATDTTGTRRVVTFDAVGPTSTWLTQLHARGLAHLASRGLTEQHAALAAFDPAALYVEDPVLHADYSRAFYPAWFHDPSAMLAPPPRAISVAGAAAGARLRREGFDWRETLRTATAPALLIHGLEDCVPADVAHEHAELRAGIRVVEVAESGHMPFFEQPEIAFAAALAFLAD